MAGSFELGFIGAGNMAEGILAAVLGKKVYSPGQVIVSDPVADRLSLFSKQFGVATTPENLQVVRDARRIVLAVKPQSFQDVAAPLADSLRGDQLLISIMAGVSATRIEAVFPRIKARVVRVMPNLPIRVGAGMAGICGGHYATVDDLVAVQAIFDAGGSSVVLTDESLMDAITAMSGSGPAYFYLFVEAMVAGGMTCGLSEHDAMRLAQHACLGAAKMMLETHESPADLRRKVTSKGGTTQAAIEHMQRCGVPDAIRDAVKAAFARGRELGA